MGLSQIFFIFALAQYALSASPIKDECRDADDYVNCLKGALQDFFRKTSRSIPEHKLESTDPVTIPSFTIAEDNVGFTSEFKNVKVTGFKDMTVFNLIISDSRNKPDAEYESQLTIKFDLLSEGDVTVNLKSGKTYSGTFKYGGSIKTDSKYSYTEKRNNDLNVYEMYPETTICKVDNINTTLSPELQESLNKDPESRGMLKDFEEIAPKHYEKVLCKMASIVLKTAMDNLRSHVREGL